MSHDFQAEPAFLGMAGSPGFVREPEGNRIARTPRLPLAAAVAARPPGGIGGLGCRAGMS
jgi:hypothetical protein